MSVVRVLGLVPCRFNALRRAARYLPVSAFVI
jgi:hypothetical protein